MRFFTSLLRPRTRRPAPIRARLRVEQLEARQVPTLVLPHNEFMVNSTTSYTDQTSSIGSHGVAADSAGDFIATWAGQNQSTGNWAVYGRRFAASGTALGPEFQVNTFANGNQTDPCVAMDAAGDSVIVWASYGQDGSGWGVYGQRYNTLGLAQGGEFRVNTFTQGDQEYGRVAMDSVGNFTVVWSSNGQDGSGWGVYGQQYNALGLAQGGEFRVNTFTQGDQEYGTVAMNGTGNFVVTWQSYGQGSAGWSIHAQRYSACGVAQGAEFQVNTTNQGNQEYPSAAMDTAGDIIIAWSSQAQAGSYWTIMAARYNASGVAQGSPFQVSAYSGGDQLYPSAAMDGSGNFTIVWQGHVAGQSGWQTCAQQYTSCGACYGPQTVVNSTAAGNHQGASIAMTATGQAVIVWSGNGYGDSTGVFAQQLGLL